MNIFKVLVWEKHRLSLIILIITAQVSDGAVMPLLSLAHLSWQLKQDFLIACCMFVGKFFTFSSSLEALRHHPWVKGIRVCSNVLPCPFPRRDTCNAGNTLFTYKKSHSPAPLDQLWLWLWYLFSSFLRVQ